MSSTAASEPTTLAALERLVEVRASGSVLLPKATRALPIRFDSVDEDQLILLMYVRPDPEMVSGGMACVQCLGTTQTRVFLAPVREVIEDDGVWYLVLTPPGQVASLESRRAFRIPVAPGDLPVEVNGPDGTCVGVVRDLSALGLGVAVAEGRRPAVGDSVRVKLGEGDHRRVLSGRVIQVSKRHVGVAFTSDVPSRIGDLVADAEARWRDRKGE